jgi:exopolyphosphatase/guanosine-5'-triphosphate,3'-diphosphate pyrophosphatase
MEKIAIIDIGSNTARIVIVNILEGGYFNVIDELKEPVRLAKDMEADGFLRPVRVQQMVQTLKTFKNLYESHKVARVFAYATAAVRRAKNQKSFIDEVLANCGIKLTVLTQEEEAGLVYTGVINSMDVPKGLIVDIGGGSIKLIQYNRRVLLAQDTLPFGAVTLTEKFSNASTDPVERSRMVEDYVKESLNNIEWFKNIDPDAKLICVGGCVRNLGKISRRFRKYPLDMAHNYHIGWEEFENIYNTIKPLDIDKASRIKGLSSTRADILPASLSCLKAIKDTAEFPEIVISGAGMREGAMFRYAVPITLEKPISDILGHSIYTMLHHFNMNIEHSEHVFDISLQLYRQLKVLHKLPRNYIKVLRVAAQLHDIGSSFKFYDHPKHSFYFILNSNLYGIPQKDLVVAALVASRHGRLPFDGIEIQQYLSMLSEEDIEAVKKLGVIVRIAECFDRSMGAVITNLTCDVLGDSVILKTEAISDCTLEIKDALNAVPEFRRAFKKNLEIL